MAISDINRAMAAYAQPTEYDRNAWKTAFDISNAFNNTSKGFAEMQSAQTKAKDDWRKYYEQVQTQDSRVKSENMTNDYTATKYNTDRLFMEGHNEAMQKLRPYFFDEYGNARPLPEAWQAASADGVKIDNAFGLNGVYNASLQEQANQQALKDWIIQNSFGTTYDALGNPVSTGRLDSVLLNTNLNNAVATGKITRSAAELLRADLLAPQTNQPPERFNGLTYGMPGTQQAIIGTYALNSLPVQQVNATAQPVAQAQAVQPQTINLSTGEELKLSYTPDGLLPKYAQIYEEQKQYYQNQVGKNGYTQALADLAMKGQLQNLLKRQERELNSLY